MMMMMMVGVAYGGHMLVWNGNNLQYSTEYKVAGVEFLEGSEATGDLKVKYIAGDGGRSLEIRGPMENLQNYRVTMRIHEGKDCNGDVVHEMNCNGCQSFVSIKILESKKLLTIGEENDVLGKSISLFSKGDVLGCANIDDEAKKLI